MQLFGGSPVKINIASAFVQDANSSTDAKRILNMVLKLEGG